MHPLQDQGATFRTALEKNGEPYSQDCATVAGSYGIDRIKVASAAEFKPAVHQAIKSKRPVVTDVFMQREPVPHYWPLEHHGRLLAPQEGPPRRRR
jgi:thiamine pyrophosphate-dependent acetolactate synthase large subunit-like protein